MLITKDNVVEHLTKGDIKTSMVYPIRSERHYIVEEDIVVKLTDESIIKIPKGFTFDGSSSPRFLWWSFPPYGDFFFAAILHDYLYHIKYPKNIADKEMLIWSNIINKRNFGKKVDNYLRYYAVVLFGMKQYLD